MVHTLRSLFKQENNDKGLLIDAGNTFNTVNRKVFFHSFVIVCPAISTFAFNCYALTCTFINFGGYEISSVEGTTNSDSIAMVWVLSQSKKLLANRKGRTQRKS